MKKKIFLGLILVLLFVFGILIYDFSDEMDSLLTGHKWYLEDNNELYVLSLKNNNFSYVKENGDTLSEYNTCKTYHYNSNVSMLKLRCNNETKKMYISSYDDKKLVLNEDGEEKVFYSSKELALIEEFKSNNHLTDKEYNKLISINFNDGLIIDYKKFNELYKNKKLFYLGIITNNVNYENVYNYQVLNNLISNSTKKIYLINIDKLNSEELTKINRLINIDNGEENLNIYEIKNKKIKCKLTINALNKSDINKYTNI